MFKNYLKIALRKMKKNIGFSVINITGLAFGMACCILIALWVLDELSYDSFHPNANNIYGLVNDQTFEGKTWHINSTPIPLAQAVKEDFPEIIASTRYDERGNFLLKNEDKIFYEKLSFADQSFLDMFSFPLISGDKRNALSNPYSIVMTEKFAKKYFGNENPVGKILNLNNESNLTVTGILKNAPNNTKFKFEAIVSYETRIKINPNLMGPNAWNSNTTQTYVLLNGKTTTENIKSKIKDYVRKKINNNDAPVYSIVPLKEVRFSDYYGGGKRINSITIFSTIAFIILLIACINFMNLSIVSSARRAMEIGLRKVVGATRKNTVVQFLGEFTLLSLISLLFALILVILLLPLFNNLIGKEMELGTLFNGTTLLVLFGVIIFTGLLGGGYPALYISSLKPIIILKGNTGAKFKKSTMRRVLVVFQFFLSAALIIVMSVIYSQLNFMKDTNPGFDKEQILYIQLKAGAAKNYQVLKNSLTGSRGITNLTGVSNLPTDLYSNTDGLKWVGKSKENNTLIHTGNVDYSFFETFKIDIIEGKGFLKEFPSESEKGVVINEEMVKLMGRNRVVGEYLTQGEDSYKIIGIMKNFHNVSMDQKIPPLVLNYISSESHRTGASYQIIKIHPDNISATLDVIKTKWMEINPSLPFEYNFLDEEFDKMYKSEERLSNIIGSFAIIAVFISALGLFGLASYTAEQRKKEIAVRKVLGSTISNVVNLLVKEYFYLVLIANVIAWPLGYYIAGKWIDDYAYKVDIGFGVFALAGLAALIIMAVSVGYQSIKAALANPTDSLRSE